MTSRSIKRRTCAQPVLLGLCPKLKYPPRCAGGSLFDMLLFLCGLSSEVEGNDRCVDGHHLLRDVADGGPVGLFPKIIFDNSASPCQTIRAVGRPFGKSYDE